MFKSPPLLSLPLPGGSLLFPVMGNSKLELLIAKFDLHEMITLSTASHFTSRSASRYISHKYCVSIALKIDQNDNRKSRKNELMLG